MLDAATRKMVMGRLNSGLADLAKLAYGIDLDSTQFGQLASDAFKAANRGTIAPEDKFIPPKVWGKRGIKKYWCAHCGRWTEKVELDPASATKIHGGRKGCGCPVEEPDGDGFVSRPEEGSEETTAEKKSY